MASAWGQSWGTSWGNSWGNAGAAVVADQGGGVIPWWWQHYRYRQDAVAPGCEFRLWVEFDPGEADGDAKTKARLIARSLALTVGGTSGAAWAALVVHAHAIGCEFGWTASWRQSGASGRAAVGGSDLANVLAMAAGAGWGSGHVGGDVVLDAAVQARRAARVYGAASAGWGSGHIGGDVVLDVAVQAWRVARAYGAATVHGRECVLLTRLIPGGGMGGRGYDPVVIDNDLLLLCA